MLDKAEALSQELIRIRRDIHRHPELSFQEFRTAKLVADTLSEIGIETQDSEARCQNRMILFRAHKFYIFRKRSRFRNYFQNDGHGRRGSSFIR